MKITKTLGLIAIIVVLVIAAVISITKYEANKNANNDLLTLKTIATTLEEQGVNIEKDNSKSPKDYKVKDVKPSVYSVDKDKGTLLVYIFESIEERKNAITFHDRFSRFEWVFVAKNACLMYQLPEMKNPDIETIQRVSEPIDLISDIVFMSLNDGEVIIYKGESSSWRLTYTLKSYDYFWTDQEGNLINESKYNGESEFQYKLDDIEAVGPVELTYEGILSSGSSTGNTINSDGYFKTSRAGASSGDSRVLTSCGEKTSYIIKWNDEEETIILTAQ